MFVLYFSSEFILQISLLKWKKGYCVLFAIQSGNIQSAFQHALHRCYGLAKDEKLKSIFCFVVHYRPTSIFVLINILWKKTVNIFPNSIL